MFEELSSVQKNAIEHLKNATDFAKQMNNSKIEKDLLGLIDKLKSLRYSIAIIGHMKRGKSTLLNVLLGRTDDNISPVASEVCTASIIKYIDLSAMIDHEKEEAVIYFTDDKAPVTVAFEELKYYITEKENPENKKNIEKVEVFGKFPLLNELVILVDTPGTGTIYSHHDTLVSEILPLSDAIIQPIAADIPLESSEIELLKEIVLLNKDKVFFVMTKWDTIEEDDKKEVIDWVKSQLREIGFGTEKLYYTTAKDVFSAMEKGEMEKINSLMEKSGIKELEHDLENFIATRSKKNILYVQIKNYLDYISNFGTSAIEQIEADLDNCKVNLHELEKEEKMLKEDGKNFKKECDKKLKEFIKIQKKALNSFIRRLDRKGDRIADRLTDKIENNKKLLDNIKMSYKLSEIISKECYLEAEPLLIELEESLNDARESLNKEIVSDFDLYIKKQKSRQILAPASSSVAAAVVGGTGVVGAGATISAAAAVPATFSSFTTALGSFTYASSQVGVASQGLGPWLWGILAGKGATSAGAASIYTTNSLVTSSVALGGTLISSIATGGLAIAGFVVAKKISTIGIQKINSAKIQSIVDSTIKEMITTLEEKSSKQLEFIKDDFNELIEEVIGQNEKRVEVIKKQIEKADPSLEGRLIEEKQMATQLIQNNEQLKTKLLTLN
jgi:hypothetical protein